MRILSEKDYEKIKDLVLYLTKEEAKEMIYSLVELIEKPYHNHFHMDSDDNGDEITLCLYDKENIEKYGYNQRSVKLIMEDE